MLIRFSITDSGAPATGLTPTWHSLITGTNGTDKSASAPTISEIGAGYYGFNIDFGTTPWDVTTEDLVGWIDGGVALPAAERYLRIELRVRDLATASLTHDGDHHLDGDRAGEIDIYDIDGSTVIVTYSNAVVDGVQQRRLLPPQT